MEDSAIRLQNNIVTARYWFFAYSPQPGLVAMVDINASMKVEEEQRKHAVEIAAINEELKPFVSTIAHDFRPPMVNEGFLL
jgi:hypothetical protein